MENEETLDSSSSSTVTLSPLMATSAYVPTALETRQVNLLTKYTALIDNCGWIWVNGSYGGENELEIYMAFILGCVYTVAFCNESIQKYYRFYSVYTKTLAH